MKKLILFVGLLFCVVTAIAQTSEEWQNPENPSTDPGHVSNYLFYSINKLPFKGRKPEILRLGIRYVKNLPFIYIMVNQKVLEEPTYKHSKIDVEFDDGPVEQVECLVSDTNDPTMLELDNTIAFIAKMKKAKLLKIAPRLIYQAPLVATFNIYKFQK